MRKIIGHMTEFPALRNYRRLLLGEITVEEYSKTGSEPITTLIYEDEIKKLGEMEELLFQKQYLEKLLGTIQTKISVLEHAAKKKIMDNCKHELSYDGHGHNDDHYTCHKCGYGEWQ